MTTRPGSFEAGAQEEESELTAESALAALRSACKEVEIRPTDPHLIRVGSNAVYRLGGDVIARVGRSLDVFADAQKQVVVAAWLEAEGYPATRALDVAQPVVADGRVVTFWRSVSDREEYAPIADVAELIRRLHALSSPAGLDLPELQPFGGPDESLPNLCGLSADDADFLRERFERARADFAATEFALPRGVIHGDANVGNVILDSEGTAIMIDLDSFATGPREWDLIQTAIFYDRFGWHPEKEYETFVRVYGYDIMSWSGYPALADMREVAMTVWLSRRAATDEKSAAEATKRIHAMRTGASRKAGPRSSSAAVTRVGCLRPSPRSPSRRRWY